VNIGNVIVNKGAGNNPPSINVATFDGQKNDGNPYYTNSVQVGYGDTLVSRFIDLNSVPLDDKDSIYFSFFYQKQGAGEEPDAVDHLSVWFRDNEKKWVQVWSSSDETENPVDNFKQVNLRIEGNYFDPYFQFKIASYGNLTGAFDTWHVDYVYLGRASYNATDTSKVAFFMPGSNQYQSLFFRDRAIINYPGSWLGQYTAIPYDIFKKHAPSFLSGFNLGITSLEDKSRPSPINSSTILLDYNTKATLKVYEKDKPEEPTLIGNERRTKTYAAPEKEILDQGSDSLYVETLFYLDADDKPYLRVNDTVRVLTVLDKDLAYDDGSAEFSAGVNQQAGQLVVKFFLPEGKVISGVKINFTNFSSGSVGIPFYVRVWDELGAEREGLLYEEQQTVISSGSVNEYGYYKFNTGVPVTDTFYVGIQQTIDDFFNIGLDKNTNSGDKIYYNVDGNWEQNTQIDGSLMIRPVFDVANAIAVKGEVFNDINVYPNPSKNVLSITGQYDDVQFMNVLGKRIHPTIMGRGRFGITGINERIIIVNVSKRGLVNSYKIIKE